MSAKRLYALIAVSGMSGLMYEILWIRALGLHFGTSTPAIALVTSTFMAGLAAGNWIFGPRADRMANPLRAYRRIELGIGLSGLVVSLLVFRRTGWLDSVTRAAAHAGALAGLLHAAVLAALLLVPTTLMGATLPVLSRALTRHGFSARTVGALYVCNTAGAVLGALVPDFWLIGRYGFTWSACAAAAGNLLVAAALQPPTAAAAPAPQAIATDDPTALPFSLALAAVSGFAGMVLEVLWSRTLEHWTVGLASSFSVLLAVYLALLACGAACTRRWADRTDVPLRAAALLLSLAGIAVVVPLLFAPAFRSWQAQLWPLGEGVRRPSMLHLSFDALCHALYLEGGACLAMGAAFPFVVRALVRVGSAGAATGRLFTVNTLAGVLGALTACYVWLPNLGEQDSYFASALLLAAAGVLTALPFEGARPARSLLASASMLSVLAALAWIPAHRVRGASIAQGGEVIASREGPTTGASAVAYVECGQLQRLLLKTQGVSMSDTGFSSRRYMGMMAHSAMLSAPAPRRALLICYGVGNTARALLSYAELARLDVVDISREVLGLSSTFARARGSDPLIDPRTHVIIDDGRHHLLVSDERYDVITAEPPPPNDAGVVNLYSREFYRLARERLQPNGVITQWLPVFQLADSESLAMIAAFVAELPYSALLYGQEEHLILIGSNGPLALDPARAAQRLRAPEAQHSLAECGIRDVSDIYGALLQTDAELRKLVAGIEPLSDDRPSIQYPWEGLRGSDGFVASLAHDPWSNVRWLPAGTDAATRKRVLEMVRATQDVVGGLPHRQTRDAASWELSVGNAIGAALAERPRHEAFLELLRADAERAQVARSCLAAPGADALLALGRQRATELGRAGGYDLLAGSVLTLARRAFYLGDYDEALHWLERRPPTAQGLLLMAASLRGLGRSDEARTYFEQAARASHASLAKTWLHELATLDGAPLPPNAGPFAVP